MVCRYAGRKSRNGKRKPGLRCKRRYSVWTYQRRQRRTNDLFLVWWTWWNTGHSFKEHIGNRWFYGVFQCQCKDLQYEIYRASRICGWYAGYLRRESSDCEWNIGNCLRRLWFTGCVFCGNNARDRRKHSFGERLWALFYKDIRSRRRGFTWGSNDL